MPRNIVKILEKNFGDMKAGEKMLISSPEVISSYISRIPVGTTITPKEMRHALAKEKFGSAVSMKLPAMAPLARLGGLILLLQADAR